MAVILVSIDGCRWDLPARAETPVLDRLMRDGVRAERLTPIFPTKTFPNHYSMVTGLYAEDHGIVANSMYDPVFDATFGLSDRAAVADGRWWGGEPIWVTAEKKGLRTAAYYWPGSEAEIGGVRPTYWVPFDDGEPREERIERILAWLDLPPGERPSFITLYFSDVDHAAHGNDPDTAPEPAAALSAVDETLGRLLAGLEERGLGGRVDLIVTSDHGMAATSPERVIFLDDYLDPESVRIVDWNPIAAIWPSEERIDEVYAALDGAHPHLEVYRREEIPERFHYRRHRRVPPLVGIPDEGWSVTSRDYFARRPEVFEGGNHGYDPALPSMGAIFVASGPSFRRGVVSPPFENIHLYALLCEILGLEPAPNDGSLEAVRHLLRRGAR